MVVLDCHNICSRRSVSYLTIIKNDGFQRSNTVFDCKALFQAVSFWPVYSRYCHTDSHYILYKTQREKNGNKG